MSKQDMEIIVKQLYPMVEKEASIPSFKNKFKRFMGKFIESRHDSLYDNAPYDRIIYSTEDANDFIKLLNINKNEVAKILKTTYFGKIARFHPRAVKDEVTILALCLIRYFYLNKDENELNLAKVYMGFSGKAYPSIHYSSYRVASPSKYRHIMEYAVNNEMNNKYDIKKYGNVINSIKSISDTWINKYSDRFESFDDEDIVYLTQQLLDRIKSFMQNIAEVYYRVYESKDRYMTYDSDDLSDESYRLADNDSLKVERYLESAITKLISSSVDVSLIRISSNNNIRPQELRSIIESIVDDKNNIPIVRELVGLLLSDYMSDSTIKDPASNEFIAKSISAKPNTKNPRVLRIKEILEEWLDENSPNYRKRKSRHATKLAYNKAVLNYFVLVINKAAK